MSTNINNTNIEILPDEITDGIRRTHSNPIPYVHALIPDAISSADHRHLEQAQLVEAIDLTKNITDSLTLPPLIPQRKSSGDLGRIATESSMFLC